MAVKHNALKLAIGKFKYLQYGKNIGDFDHILANFLNAAKDPVNVT